MGETLPAKPERFRIILTLVRMTAYDSLAEKIPSVIFSGKEHHPPMTALDSQPLERCPDSRTAGAWSPRGSLQFVRISHCGRRFISLQRTSEEVLLLLCRAWLLSARGCLQGGRVPDVLGRYPPCSKSSLMH